MKLRINAISIGQTAKTVAAIYLLFGAILGVVVMLEAIFGPKTAGVPAGIGAGLLLLIVIPLLYAIAGYIGVAIAAWIYNFVAKRTGGVEFSAVDVAAGVQ